MSAPLGCPLTQRRLPTYHDDLLPGAANNVLVHLLSCLSPSGCGKEAGKRRMCPTYCPGVAPSIQDAQNNEANGIRNAGALWIEEHILRHHVPCVGIALWHAMLRERIPISL